MSTIISFSNHKGGTGKTTSVLNMACALRNLSYTVLVVDLDPQSNLTYSFGVSGKERNIVELLLGTQNVSETMQQSSGINILACSPESMLQYDSALRTLPNTTLKEKLSGLPFDYILLDCPPAIGYQTTMALTASDFIVIPMQMEILAIQGLNQIINYVQEIKKTNNPNLELLGVLAVCVNDLRKLTNEVLEYIHNNYHINVFNNRVRNNVKAAEAPSFAKSVIDYAPEATSSKDYVAVTNELIKVLEQYQQISLT